MKDNITFEWWQVWVLLVSLISLATAVTHLSYSDEYSILRGLGEIAVAVLLPSATFFFRWFFKKYTLKSKQKG